MKEHFSGALTASVWPRCDAATIKGNASLLDSNEHLRQRFAVGFF